MPSLKRKFKSASRRGDTVAMDVLFEKHQDVRNFVLDYEKSRHYFFEAIDTQNLTMFQWLLKSGMEVKFSDVQNLARLPRNCVRRDDFYNSVVPFVDFDSLKQEEYKHAFDIANKSKNETLFQRLLARYYSDMTTNDQMNVFISLCAWNYLNGVKYFIEMGFNPRTIYGGFSPLIIAINYSCMDIFKFLVDIDAYVVPDGQDALKIAISMSFFSVSGYCRLCADYSCSHAALARANKPLIVDFLIDRIDDINHIDDDGNTYLHYLIDTDLIRDNAIEKIIEKLIKRGIVINKRNASNRTPLHQAIFNCHFFRIVILMVHLPVDLPCDYGAIEGSLKESSVLRLLVKKYPHWLEHDYVSNYLVTVILSKKIYLCLDILLECGLKIHLDALIFLFQLYVLDDVTSGFFTTTLKRSIANGTTIQSTTGMFLIGDTKTNDTLNQFQQMASFLCLVYHVHHKSISGRRVPIDILRNIFEFVPRIE